MTIVDVKWLRVYFYSMKMPKLLFSLILRFPFVGFQKIFLFLVAWMISEAWGEELEQAHFFVIKPSEKNTVLKCKTFVLT